MADRIDTNPPRRYHPRPKSERAWLGVVMRPLLLTLCSVPWLGSCAESPPPEPESVPPQAAEPPATELGVRVDDSGIEVRVPGATNKPVEVRLVLASGHQLSATTNGEGVARIVPKPELLFENSEVGVATVTAAGHSASVDLSGLIEAQKKHNPGAWQAIEVRREEQRKKLDQAVVFTGKIFKDKGGSELVESCQPSGPEVCYDGIDNDCDGRYDNVSCGYASGPLQWTVTWKGAADLDLYVTGPDGEEVGASAPRGTKSHLLLDRTCRGTVDGHADCPAGNVENVLASGSQVPPSGTYQARIEVRDAAETDGIIKARFSGRIGEKTWYTDVQLAPFPGVEYRVAFPVGADSDGDSVADEHDACPDEKGCYFDDLAYRGCADRDGDSVPDKIDACPGKTGLTRTDPELNGCPMVFGDAWVTNQGIQIQRRIQFNTGQATLLEDSKRLIRNVAEAIRARPESVTKMSIDGHTDEVGDAEKNVTLSNRRAKAVLEELVKNGVARDILTTRGFGETKPFTDNTTPEGRRQNRRVEFVILRPAPRTAECW